MQQNFWQQSKFGFGTVNTVLEYEHSARPYIVWNEDCITVIDTKHLERFRHKQLSRITGENPILPNLEMLKIIDQVLNEQRNVLAEILHAEKNNGFSKEYKEKLSSYVDEAVLAAANQYRVLECKKRNQSYSSEKERTSMFKIWNQQLRDRGNGNKFINPPQSR